MKARILQNAILDIIDNGNLDVIDNISEPWQFYEHPDKEIDEAEANRIRLEFSDRIIKRYRELFRIEKEFNHE